MTQRKSLNYAKSEKDKAEQRIEDLKRKLLEQKKDKS